jgi:hypothetical protein
MDVVQLLLDGGADALKGNVDMKTALHCAASRDSWRCAVCICIMVCSVWSLAVVHSAHFVFHWNGLLECLNWEFYLYYILCSNVGTTVKNSMNLRACLKGDYCVTY